MSQMQPWCSPPRGLTLGKSDVHVWQAALDVAAPEVGAFENTLAEEELRRADRFHFEKDRSPFIVGRGLLRVILGSYLKTDPEKIKLGANHHGKPQLVEENGGGGICFNLSRSHSLVLFAVARGRKVGVDLELLQPRVAEETVAERFFSPREVRTLRGLPKDRQAEAFFNCWTRKEAYVKARGEGLSLPLDQFDVSLAPGEPAQLLCTNVGPQETWRWSLRELIPRPGYIGALAVEGRHWQLRCWEWAEANCSPL